MNSTMSEEAINKRNEMFREVHPAGPATHEKTFVTVDESVYREAMTLKDVQRKNEETVNALFEKESKQDEIGSVFEKGQKLEEKVSNERDDVKPTANKGIDSPTSNNGLDPKDIDALKKELSDQEKGMKGPSEPSLNFVK
jgi:hypothetical protein